MSECGAAPIWTSTTSSTSLRFSMRRSSCDPGGDARSRRCQSIGYPRKRVTSKTSVALYLHRHPSAEPVDTLIVGSVVMAPVAVVAICPILIAEVKLGIEGVDSKWNRNSHHVHDSFHASRRRTVRQRHDQHVSHRH